MRSRFEGVAEKLHSLGLHVKASKESADGLLRWTQLEPEELDACEAWADRATQESDFGAGTSIEDLSVIAREAFDELEGSSSPPWRTRK
jgi:hypothetical protein